MAWLRIFLVALIAFAALCAAAPTSPTAKIAAEKITTTARSGSDWYYHQHPYYGKHDHKPRRKYKTFKYGRIRSCYGKHCKGFKYRDCGYKGGCYKKRRSKKKKRRRCRKKYCGKKKRRCRKKSCRKKKKRRHTHKYSYKYTEKYSESYSHSHSYKGSHSHKPRRRSKSSKYCRVCYGDGHDRYCLKRKC